MKGGKGGQAARRSSSPCARLVIPSPSGCAVCAAAAGRAPVASSQVAAGTRVFPGASLSVHHSLELGGSNKHAPQGKCSSGGCLRTWSVLMLCSCQPMSSAVLTGPGETRMSSSWARPVRLQLLRPPWSRWGRQVPATVPTRAVLPPAARPASAAPTGLSLGQQSSILFTRIIQRLVAFHASYTCALLPLNTYPGLLEISSEVDFLLNEVLDGSFGLWVNDGFCTGGAPDSGAHFRVLEIGSF